MENLQFTHDLCKFNVHFVYIVYNSHSDYINAEIEQCKFNVVFVT